MKRILYIVLIFLSNQSFGSHIVGSDFTYKCLNSATNTYLFTLDIYRDCRDPSLGGGQPNAITFDNPAYISIFSGTGTFLSFDSINSGNTSIIPPGFSNDCINNYPIKCLNRLRVQFQRTLTPSPSGYSIVYQRCCRNESINNLQNPGGTGASFYVEIPPAPIACNNSAEFVNFPPQIICINNPLIYDHSATDDDGDSLSYEFCPAVRGGSENSPKPINTTDAPPFANVIYRSPYSALNPMAGNPQIVIDPMTGMITGTPNIQGIFVVTVCCKEWRNGVLINTIRRDFQFEITNCSKAVIANTPLFSDEPNTYIINCSDFSVTFENTSQGGFNYHWDFGVSGTLADTSDQFQPTFVYPDTGTYEVKLLVNEGTTCPDSITRIVKVYPSFDAEFSYTGQLCPGLPVQFTDLSTSDFVPVNSWSWNFDDGSPEVFIQNPIHTFPNTGQIFNVTLVSRNFYGCRDQFTLPLNIPKVDLNAGRDTVIPQNTVYQFNATGTVNYNWSPSNYLTTTVGPNPTGVFVDTGRFTYIVTGTTDNGCQAADTINIIVTDGPYIFVPSAFTPNGDGLNDFIKVLASGYRKLNYFRIFDRWGKRVYESQTFDGAWDGTVEGELGEISTYFYLISVLDDENEERQFRGDITLLR